MTLPLNVLVTEQSGWLEDLSSDRKQLFDWLDRLLGAGTSLLIGCIVYTPIILLLLINTSDVSSFGGVFVSYVFPVR